MTPTSNDIDSSLMKLHDRLARISTRSTSRRRKFSLNRAMRVIDRLLVDGNFASKRAVLRMGTLLERSAKLAEKDSATAFHEAGHAVAAFALGIPLLRKGVSIVPGDGYDGVCYHSGSIGFDPSTGSPPDRVRRRAERQAIVALAGMQAQRRYCALSLRSFHGHSDSVRAVDLLSHFTLSTDELNAWLRLLQIRTNALVELWWPTILEFAEVLIDKRSLTGREATEIIRKAVGHIAGECESLSATLER